jgi:DNA-binding transcriptional ArsR family regulator
MVHNTVNHEDDGLDAVFAALSNPHRRRIVDLLSLQPASIQQLAERIGMSLTAIHRHITLLEDSGLVQRKKSGRVNFLAVRRATLRRIQEWSDQYRSDWGTDDESLENYVASIERANRAGTEPNTKERDR